MAITGVATAASAATIAGDADFIDAWQARAAGPASSAVAASADVGRDRATEDHDRASTGIEPAAGAITAAAAIATVAVALATDRAYASRATNSLV